MTATLTKADIDIAQAARFLDMMAEGEPVTFQTFDDTRRERRELSQRLHGSIEACASTLRSLNKRGAGIFWMFNYGDGKGRKTENVTGIRALALDLDGAPLQAVLAAGVEPHAVVESSPGKWHVYWLVTGCSLDQFAPAQKALAAKFNGDPSVHDLPRVLRVPGFLHRKGEPFVTRIVSLEPIQPYQFDDLVCRLGLDFSAPRRRPQRVDATTGEILNKVAAGGRHAHLIRRLSDLNWRGIPEAGIRAALHQINEAECDPPKDAAEVDALVTDWLKRYAGQHGRDAAKPKESLPGSGQRFTVHDAAALLKQEIRAVNYVVPGWIPEGLLLLAAAPKVGKSTLILQVCVSVAAGLPFWGVNVPAAKVLMIDLETNARRLRRKLEAAGVTSLEPGRLLYATEWPRGMAGVDRIAEMLDADPGIKLVVIDTLQRFRDAGGGNRNAYAADYEALGPLQQLCRERSGLAIVVVHHKRKAASDDPIDSINGSAAIAGAADGIWLMSRKGTEYMLHVQARDWERDEDEFRIERDGGQWRLTDGPRYSDSEREVLHLLDVAKGMTAVQLGGALKVSKQSAHKRLHRMAGLGMVAYRDGAWFPA